MIKIFWYDQLSIDMKPKSPSYYSHYLFIFLSFFLTKMYRVIHSRIFKFGSHDGLTCPALNYDSPMISPFFSFYAPNFEKVEGAYCFGLVRPSVCLSVLPSITN